MRRAVRRAYQLGVTKPVVPELVAATVEVMGDAYPELRRKQDVITTKLAVEEERFRDTLASGSAILDEALGAGGSVSGAVAFRLHDTFGFPIELTQEIAEERGVEVDMAGFDAAMEEQRAARA